MFPGGGAGREGVGDVPPVRGRFEEPCDPFGEVRARYRDIGVEFTRLAPGPAAIRCSAPACASHLHTVRSDIPDGQEQEADGQGEEQNESVRVGWCRQFSDTSRSAADDVAV